MRVKVGKIYNKLDRHHTIWTMDMYQNTETIAGNVDMIWYHDQFGSSHIYYQEILSASGITFDNTTCSGGAGTSFLSSDCARKMVTWVSLLPALS